MVQMVAAFVKAMKAPFWIGLVLMGAVSLLVSIPQFSRDEANGVRPSSGIEPWHGQSGHLKLVLFSEIAQALAGPLRADAVTPTSDEILARLECENNKRHSLLKEYSGSRQYTLQNLRFGKQAAVGVLMTHHPVEGERYTVLTRSGSDKLNGIIDRVIASEAGVSVPPEKERHQITAANYRVRLLGTEGAAGRNCYLLELTPKFKSRYLIVGKAWVDAGSYALVRIEGQFAASFSTMVGAPHISEEFIEVRGFWLPGHVRSVTSSFLLGPTELEILFSNYQFDPASVRPIGTVGGNEL